MVSEDDAKSLTQLTFARRADHYNDLSPWVNDEGLLAPLVPPVFGNGFALDLCAGTGAVTQRCVSRGWQTTATDISEEMLEKVDRTADCVVADMHSLPFSDSQFDLVVCRQGLQYAALDAVFREIRRVSNDRVNLGHITMMDPCDLPFWSAYFDIASPGRRNIFRPGQLEAIALSHGFRVLSQETLLVADTFGGPIAHLEDRKREYLTELFLNAPEHIREHYALASRGDLTIEYTNRWEFICLEKS